MSADAVTTYRTRFGMFAPCDRETYRRLKRIRHLAGFAEAERRRWDRSQRRLPHNRAFRRRRGGRVVREPVSAERMVFGPLYELRPAGEAEAGAGAAWPAGARLARPTELFSRFFEDYHSARRPKATAGEVRPLKLAPAEIDRLLGQIELWNLRR